MAGCSGGGICKGDFEGNLQLFILQPTPFCNIDCDYCYLPDRANRAVMSGEVLEAAVRGMFSSVFLGHKVTVCWHAGEPLIVPLAHYRDTVDLVRRHNSRGTQVTYNVQTNGTLLTQQWCDFFAEHGFSIGVSLDGPKPVHDRHRRDRKGRGTFDKVMSGIELLKRNNVDFHVISVISPTSLVSGSEFYRFFKDVGVQRLGINVQESDGCNSAGEFLSTDHDEELKRFIRELRLSWQQDSYAMVLREFTRTVRLISRDASRPPIKVQDSTPWAIISVDYLGNFSTFSPELMGSPNSGQRFSLGNVLETAFEDAVYTEKFKGMLDEINAGIARCRSECPYFSLCGGGAPSNKFAEHGKMSGSETRACKTGVQTFCDETVDLLLDAGSAVPAL